MEEIQNKLNEEYKSNGVISIRKMHEENIPISNISYIKDLMNKVSPLDIKDPIVVAKSYGKNNYKLIDGYHRLKDRIIKNELNIKCIVLDDYGINYTNDTLYDFLETLIGKTITFISDYEIKVDDKLYIIEPNEGCGGCSNGWSSIEMLSKYQNEAIQIKIIESKKINEDVYDLFINNQKIAKIDTGYGNGYYGGDFIIKLIK